MTFCPALIVAGPVLVVRTSADAVTLVLTRLPAAEPLLLAGIGSAVADDDAAMFSTTCGVDGIVTVTVNTCDAPEASDAITGHVTTRPLTVPPPLALTNVTVAGSVSVTTTLLAADGPLLLAVTVYTCVLEASAVAGPDFATATSACSTTVVVTRAAGSDPLLLARWDPQWSRFPPRCRAAHPWQAPSP